MEDDVVGKNQKRNRRPKQIRRELWQMKLMYTNIRGIKSKIDSLSVILDEVKPTIALIVETHLDETEAIQIPNYEVFMMDGTSNSGGIIVAIRERIKTISVSLSESQKI